MNWRKGKLAIANAINLDLTPQQIYFAQSLRRYVRPGCRWLDVGCGHTLLPDWAMPMDEQQRLVGSAALMVGVDMDEGIVNHPLLPYRIMAVGGMLPFKNGTFDLVTANMVVEHVGDPSSFLSDISRVLRPGGRFLFITPNRLNPYILVARMVPDRIKRKIVWYLEGRQEEDIFPTHYRLNDVGAIRRLASQTEFETEDLTFIGMPGLLERLGPLAWIECFLLKGLDLFSRNLQMDIVGVLRRRYSQ